MKIARVFITQYPGRSVGDIYDVFSLEGRPAAVLEGTLKEVEVADDFDMSIMQGVVAENGDVTFEESPEKVAAKVAAGKSAQILERYNDMNNDVLAQMTAVFGTTRTDSASAFYETWKLMVQKPVLFFEKGLKADIEAGGFLVGAALDTIQKVEDYANARIALAETYSVYRMERIEQFKTEKAAIEAS